MNNLAKKEEPNQVGEKASRWFKDWRKLIDAIIPPGPICRDCADEDGTCPMDDGLPCDTTDRAIEIHRRLKSKLTPIEPLKKEKMIDLESSPVETPVRSAEEILKAKLRNIHFIRSDETYALVLEAMEEYASQFSSSREKTRNSR